MTRFRLDLAYDGTDFHGWAVQPGQRTVQGVLQDALAKVLHDLGQPPGQAITVAGRTDAGVHARGQVAHLDVAAEPDRCEDIRRLLTRLLPDDVDLRRCAVAPAGFDARFGATGRTYCYRLWDTVSTVFPATRRAVTIVPLPLSVDAMDEAAQALLGLRDFAAFCRPREGATTIRRLRRFDVLRALDPSATIECWLEADAFCHSMVRSLVGAVVEVGSGHRDATWLRTAAAARSRASHVPVLPPGGLTLESVSYPPDDELAARAEQARQTRTLDDEADA